MFIKELYEKKDSVISFEVFPPKQESSLETISNSLAQIASLNPGFISGTYGAGGTGSNSMTTTVKNMKLTISAIREAGIECRIMVGGAVLTSEYAAFVGADFFVKDAREGVEVAKKVL